MAQRRTVSESSVGRSSTRIDLLDALEKKYSTGSLKAFHCVIYIAPGAPGKTKSGGLRVPANLNLNSFNISLAGESEKLLEKFANVTELDLTGNLLSEWSEIGKILDHFPKLEFLNLTRNPLKELRTVDELDTTESCRRYPNVLQLALNFTSVSWSTVSKLLYILPNLKELYLSGNDYTTVQLPTSSTVTVNTQYHSLKILQLTGNKIEDWKEVCYLGAIFSGLETLVLAHNPITKCGEQQANRDRFPLLATLNMNNTKILEWEELEGLTTIENLSDIRLTSIPLLNNFDDLKRRQLLSVYFPLVSKLNGSLMTSNERETAERVFLHHFKEMDESSRPSRYKKLVEKHGEVAPLAPVDLTPEESVEMKVIIGLKEELMTIPTKVTIGQLRRKLKPTVGSSKFRIFHQTAYGGPEEIKQNNRFVWALNFRDGDTLFCDSVYERAE